MSALLMVRIISLFLFATLSAETLGIALAGDALYWKPAGSFDYVIRGPRTRVMKPDYHWGARARVSLSVDVLRSALSGTTLYYRSSESAATFGTNLTAAFDVGPDQNRVVATLGFQYWLADLCLGHVWVCTDAFAMAFGVGARYADIRENQRVDGNTTKSLVRYIYSGAGPGLSVGADLCVWQGVHVHGRAALWALVNRTRTRLTSALDGLTTFPHVTSVSPASEIRLAIHYLCLEIGYELHHYWDAVEQILSFPTFVTPSWSQRQLRSAGFAGPYVRLEVRF